MSKFIKQLQEIGINPSEYLKIAQNQAKLYKYNPHQIIFSTDDKHKLIYIDVENNNKKVYFGATGYNDFIIYKLLDKFNGTKYADRKRFLYRRRAYELYEKSAPKSPAKFSMEILW